MQIKIAKKQIEKNLTIHTKLIFPNHPISEIYNYTIFPPGKIFRPFLVWAMALDFSNNKNILENPWSSHSLLCSSIEIHHAYSLIHDDLPCMDNDDFRRNKPSAHKKFGEWRALLAGDSLLVASFQLLSKIKSPNIQSVIKFITWATGPKGLIHGQVLDLSEEMALSFQTLKKTHLLKTGRLIQAALLSSFMLIEKPKKTSYSSKRIGMDIYKLGHYTGLIFQFLDDLTDLSENKINQHEKKINPWLNYHDQTFNELIKDINQLKTIVKKHNLLHFTEVMNQYTKKLKSIITEKQSVIIENIPNETKDNLNLLTSLLDKICK